MSESKMEKDQNVSQSAAPTNGKQTDEQGDTPESKNPYFLSAEQSPKALPAWLDHFNVRDMKILFKCSFAVWITTLLILIRPTLVALGQATFFGCLVLFIAPPSGVVFYQFLAGFTVILGLALGWAWGVITMKAALATRPSADLKARYTQLQESAPKNTTYSTQASGQGTYLQIQIYNGFMLDTRVSVTYFCMMCLFIYLVARIRVASPKLTLVSMYAIIVSDLFLTIAPLLPTFIGTLPQLMVKPVAVAVGVGVVCNVLFFPQSTTHIVLDGMQAVFAPMGGFLEACLLNFQHPRLRMQFDKLTQTKTQVIGAYKAVDPATSFLPMDFSIGRWGPKDISCLVQPFRQVLISFIALLQLQITREESKITNEELQKWAEAIYDNQSEKALSKVGHHQLTQSVDFRTQSRHPDTEDLLEKSLYALSQSSGALLETCQECLAAINEALRSTEPRIFFNRSSVEQRRSVAQKHRDLLEKLTNQEKEFVNLTAEHLLAPHAYLFNENGQIPMDSESKFPPLAGLTAALLYEERILNLAKALNGMLSRVVELETEREKSRLWLPTKLQRLFQWGLKKDSDLETLDSDDDSNTELKPTPAESPAKKESKKGHKKESENTSESGKLARIQLKVMRMSNSRKRSKGSMLLLGIVNWLGDTEGLHALRVLAVTIALAVPAVIPSSAGFYYREKGIWALIMAQLGMLPYASDFIPSLITRTIGTIVGAVIGMATWYIGAGNGAGNPYGMAAIMAVVSIVFMWGRLFLPPSLMQATVLMAATAYLVVAYSWSDTHIPSYGNPGVGYRVFWRRILLVLIGFGAAAIVTFLPRPTSGNSHYRRVLSESLGSVKDRYALFVSNCRNPPSDLMEVAEKEAISMWEMLGSIKEPVQLTKFEFTTSNIDSETLSKVWYHCIGLNQNVTQLLLYATRLPPELRQRFLSVTGAADEKLIAELMAVVTLVQQSLRTGEPLPALMPTPLVARSIRYARESIDVQNVDLAKQLGEEGIRKYVSAMHAIVQLFGTVDELVMVVKRAVGETSDIALERLGA